MHVVVVCTCYTEVDRPFNVANCPENILVDFLWQVYATKNMDKVY